MRQFIACASLLAVISAFMIMAPTPSAAQGFSPFDYGYDSPYRDNYRNGSPDVVRCESKDFTFNQCPVPIDGRVRLIRQLSDTPCQRGENWGYDRNGIWVDKGCAAEFRIGSRHAKYDNQGWDNWRRHRNSRWDQTVRCESKGFEFKRCAAPGSDEVRLARQLSDTPCQRGENWDYDYRGIWVNQGCAAEFYVDRRNALN